MVATQPQNGQRKRADLKKESVGGYPRWLCGYLRGLAALPEPGSDLARDFGPDIYRRMMLDSTVSASIRTLILGGLSQGNHLSSVVGDKKDPEFEQAQKITHFCETNLDGIYPAKQDVFIDFGTAMAHGRRVAEIVLRDPKPGELQPFGLVRGLMLKAIKPKPNRVISFVVDEFLNVLGYYARPNGMGSYAAAIVDPKDVLPPEQFAAFSWIPIDSDPRGQSLLDCVYSDWWDLEMAKGELFKFIARTAGPGILARIRQGAMPPEQVPDPVTGEYPPYKSRAQAVKDEMEKWESGSVGAFEDIEEFVIVEMKGEGLAFLNTMRDCRERIREGLTLQSMAGSQAPNGTQALGQVHQDMLAYTVDYLREAMARLVKSVLEWLVVLNYGEAARRLTPNVSFTSGSPEDRAGLMKAYVLSGWTTHKSQNEAIDAEVGAPPRADNWMEDQQQADAAAQAVAVPPGTKPPANGKKPPPSKEGASLSALALWGYNPNHDPHSGEFSSGGGGGIGAGPEEEPSRSDLAELARQTSKKTDGPVQRYSEEHNEPKLAEGLSAAGLTARSVPDGAPDDVRVTEGGVITHGVELKTMVDNKNGKLTMHASAMENKRQFQIEHNVHFHTVVFDDQKVYNAGGTGQHGPDSDRRILYRRGFGSFRTGGMYEARDMAEVKTLMETPSSKLPKAAQPPKGYREPMP